MAYFSQSMKGKLKTVKPDGNVVVRIVGVVIAPINAGLVFFE
jgi:hypothetical protein